jgi:toxin ParE1/3/4
MKVRWLELAREDRREIVDYISERNIEAAIQTDDRMAQAVRLLEHHPLAGRMGRMPGTRELVINGTSFIAIYRVDGEMPVIIRIIHLARDWPPKKRP